MGKAVISPGEAEGADERGSQNRETEFFFE
jgi:hypothetical protein